jgi:hypothetical protein
MNMNTLPQPDLDPMLQQDLDAVMGMAEANLQTDQAAWQAPRVESGVYRSGNATTGEVGVQEVRREAFNAITVDPNTRVVGRASVDPRYVSEATRLIQEASKKEIEEE